MGLVSFYAALASGTMGVVSPIAAMGALVPILLGVAGGDRPGPVVWVGMTVAVAGAALASGPELDRRGLPPAGAAGLRGRRGFGFALFALDRGARASLLHTLWGMRLVSVTVFCAAALATRSVGGAGRRDLPVLAAIGLGDVSANALFAFASSRGLVSVASVLGSLYPVATLVWARVLLGERLRPVQLAGVALALVGVVLMTR